MDTHLQKVKKTYPALFKRQWPCNFTLPFAPLVISSCNGDGGVQFSKAALNVTADINDAISEIFLYRGVYYDIVEKMTFDSSKCLDCLGKYLNDADRHRNCLQALKNALKKPQQKITKCDVQSVVAVHLFAPLVANSSIKVDETSYKKSSVKPECPFCHAIVPTGDTSIGNYNVWHGVPDIVLEQNTVKIENKAYDEETFDPDVTLEYEEMGNGEPSKRPRWDTLGSQYSDDEAERAEDEEYLTNVIDVKFPSDTYMPEGIDNIHNKSCNSIHAQVLAQTIVNAFLQAKRKTQLKNSFIPSFLVSDTYITIHMYNPGFDVLLTHSSVLSIFKNTFHSDTLELNTDAILSIWLALNMHKFSKQLPMEQGDALTALHVQRSQFQSLMGPAILEIYENKLVAPLPRKDKPIKIRKYYNCEKTTDYVRECLARMFEEVPHSEMETLDKTVSILDS